MLMGNEVGMIGVCGIGGVGKTTIMKHINNDLLQLTQFDKVIWVTVSYPLNVFQIQQTIARAMNESIPEGEDELMRAAALMSIMGTVRFVLVLDDVWEKFSLNDVGIPQPTIQNGCHVVVTSRSIDLCKQLGCEIVKVQPLSEQESLTLFLDKVGHGHDILQVPNLGEIIKLVVEECAGLPLALIVIAASMKGVDDVCEWRNVLRELQDRVITSVKGSDDEIFQRLRFSYDRLNSSELQRCFMFCSLFPEDHLYTVEDLIEWWIDEGLIGELGSRKAAYDKGHALLNRLVKSCLLENNDNGCECDRLHLNMHDVVRDMAIKSVGPECGYMVKTGSKLREVPSEHEWGKDVKKVSLMSTCISNIPQGFSPKCHSLTTLTFRKSMDLTEFPESFFLAMPQLEVLDLSFTVINALPDSISDLENLTALRLSSCHMLKYLPSLAKLRRLKKLDLRCSGIESVPHGMEMLTSLEFLDFFGTKVIGLPMGMLSNFTRLNYLVLNWGSRLPDERKELGIKGVEVEKLSKLETLRAFFYDLQEWNYFVKSSDFQCLTGYSLSAGGHPYQCPDSSILIDRRHVIFCDIKLGSGGILFPNTLQSLEFFRCENLTSLDATDLEELLFCTIYDCKDVECVFDFASRSSNCISNHPLEKLSLFYLPSLQALVRSAEGVSTFIFSNLSHVKMVRCSSMRTLFTVEQLHSLQNLEEIHIENCMQLQEIVASEEGEVPVKFILPKLRKLVLAWLPNLNSVCSTRGELVCDSIETVKIRACHRLKRLPLHLPLLNGEPSLPPRIKIVQVDTNQWWESLQWDNPKAKDLLQRVLYM